jgi:signal transduction histidine kinase
MSLDSLTGSAMAGPGTGPRSRVRRSPIDRAGKPTPPSEIDTAGVALRSAMTAIRDDLGFETASLFVPASHTWELLEREGPVRRWHAVLDPSGFEGLPEAAEYEDTRAIPGIGSRLATLGCASVAILPLPDGGRVLLDSSKPCRSGGWIERSRPYLELIHIMSTSTWPGTDTPRTNEEVRALTHLIESCQQTLARPQATAEELVAAGREALRADELHLIVDLGGEIEVVGGTAEPRSRRLSRDTRTRILQGPGPGLPQAVVRKLGAWVGASSRTLAGAVGREGEETDVLLAGWAEGPALSPGSMAVAARAMSMAIVALRTRRQVVSSLMDQERSKMAYALHDGVTQSVTGAVLELEALAQRIERDPAEALAVLESCKIEIRQALTELREILFELSREGGDKTPSEALTTSIADVVKRWRLPARVAVEGDLNTVPGRVLSVAYVVIREALTNAAKHAASGNVTVSLSAGEDDLTVIVGDGGKGFTRRDIQTAREAKHVGLDMLKRRVAEIGGKLQVQTRPGKGTRVIAELPIRRKVS